jgi:hypothetical protein
MFSPLTKVIRNRLIIIHIIADRDRNESSEELQ